MTNHELMHPVGDDPNWSESYYFNFYDPDRQVGMFTRMGWRTGGGWADALHVLYLPGSRVAFTYGRREIERNLEEYDGDLDVGNLSLTCLVPHEKWAIVYDGDAQDIASGEVLLQRGDEKLELADVQIETSYKPDSIIHSSVVLSAITADGEKIRITGDILNVCPSKVPTRDGAIFINEGLARYQWGELVGYGISEHWHIVSL